MTEEQRAELEKLARAASAPTETARGFTNWTAVARLADFHTAANPATVLDLLATIARLEAEKVKDGEALTRLASSEAFDVSQVISGPLAAEMRMRMEFAEARLSSRAKDQSQ